MEEVESMGVMAITDWVYTVRMQHIKLRLIRESDLEIFFTQQQDPDAVHMAAFTHQDPSDRVAFDAHWEKIMRDPNVINRAIEVDGKLAGHVAKFVMDLKPQITYWIGREFWGRGVATQALKLFLCEITERPIYASAAFDNVGSLRVLEKCGFVRTGSEMFHANARRKEIEEVMFRLDV